MRSPNAFCVLLALLLTARAVDAAPIVLDDCDSAAAWTAEASDGVSIRLSEDTRAGARCLRIDFDFHRGAGFCVFRRPIDVEIPARYRLRFNICGEAPANNFELKLIDPTGDNVWWHNRRAFELPREWSTLTTRSSHVTFAWGPAGADSRLDRARAIEFAIAAGSGGKGTIWIDSLTFEVLPEPPETLPTPIASVSAQAQGWPRPLDAAGDVGWTTDAAAEASSLTLDLGFAREFGGLALEWLGSARPTDYEVESSDDGAQWRSAFSVRGAAGARDWVPMPDSEARFVRVAIPNPQRQAFTLNRLRILEPAQTATSNDLWSLIAAESRAGLLPAYFRGLQRNWTVMGASGDDIEALIDEDGSIEVGRLGFTLTPFAQVGDRLLTAADMRASQWLEDDELPMPGVRRGTKEWGLAVTAFVHGEAGASTLVVRYFLGHRTDEDAPCRLFVTLRPFQVLPPAQSLNITGGVSPIRSIDLSRERAVVNGDTTVHFLTPPDAVGATTFFEGEIGARLDRGDVPDRLAVNDPMGYASAFAAFDFEGRREGTKQVVLVIPLHDASPRPQAGANAWASYERMRAETAETWRSALGRVELKLPRSAAKLVQTFHSTLAYILINRDGPAIQPGSRTYERTWIRDGSLTATALLYAGFTDEVREFLDWFAPFQYEDGKVPCCVDSRGPDPVTENDSHGQYIYLVAQYFRFTQDDGALARHMPHVRLAVDHIERLIAERSTAQYRNATGLEAAKLGLVPESISHEGYSAKPMHSYWDCFWTLRGLADAHALALAAGDAEFAARTERLEREFRASLSRSLAIAMAEKQINYIPGCVELGDFDATSTSIALFPLDVGDVAPPGAVEATFARYRAWFTDRAGGAVDWKDFTPYEIRNATSFLLLGQPEFTHTMLDFFFKHQRPQAWNHWAEIVWHDADSARFIGDMPHTWVGSDFVKLVRTMFVHEEGDALHLGLGITPEWLDDPEGIQIRRFPTPWGRIGYRAHREKGVTTIEFLDTVPTPPGGLIWHIGRDHEGVSAQVDGAAAQVNADGTVVIPPSARRVELIAR